MKISNTSRIRALLSTEASLPVQGGIGRRQLLLASMGLFMGISARAAGRLGEDGLYQQDWFVDSFLTLAEDVAGAGATNKHVALLWGLHNCPACKVLHETHFSDPAIARYLSAHFDVIHLNILGDRPVTDFDGSTQAEKEIARIYAIKGTPTIQLFPADSEGLAAKPPLAREILRIEGVPPASLFVNYFRFVAQKAYLSTSFAQWQLSDAAAGRLN